LVSAVVITFHPDGEVVANLQALREQVDHLIVVDNGSGASELAPLRQLRNEFPHELLENGANLGIATALNIGVRRSLELGAEWIMLFDQDSQVTPGFTRAMVQAFLESPWGERLGTMTPVYIDKRLRVTIPMNRAPEGMEASMTSGSLYPASIFQRFGFFRDELFIDGVDYEYSLRLRRAGLVIEETPNASLLHSPGSPRPYVIGNRVWFRSTNYSPIRRYYQERNKLWVTRHYMAAFPAFCLKLFYSSAKELIKIMLAEKDKWQKLNFFFRGILDGLRNRMGPYSQL
jgi:rhamnosyltransferase